MFNKKRMEMDHSKNWHSFSRVSSERKGRNSERKERVEYWPSSQNTGAMLSSARAPERDIMQRSIFSAHSGNERAMYPPPIHQGNVTLASKSDTNTIERYREYAEAGKQVNWQNFKEFYMKKDKERKAKRKRKRKEKKKYGIRYLLIRNKESEGERGKGKR